MTVHHLAFRTNDLEALQRFYTAVLGLSLVRRDVDNSNNNGSVWLAAGPTIVMLERRQDREPTIDRTSMDLVCFSIGPTQHTSIVERLAAADTAIEGRTAYSIYFRDPDGRRIGVSSYPTPLSAEDGFVRQ